MPTIKLTKRTIEAIQPPKSGQTFYRDIDLPGFALRVGTSSKTFVVERQVRRRTVRVTLGRYGPMTPETERICAFKALSALADGCDLNAERRAKTASEMTVKEAFDDFFQRRALAVSSKPTYERTRDLYLKDWAHRPISEITKRMVLDQHDLISKKNGGSTANNVFRHFRAIHNYASAAHGKLPPNPVSILGQARAWHRERRRRSIIPIHALPKWWGAVHEEEDYVRDFLVIALFTGMRRSEIARLRWEHIDLDGKTLTVPRTKNGDPLELPISTFLFDLLLTQREAGPDAGWVFPGPGAGHIVETKRFYARVAKRSGISFTLHDLRRNFITIAEGEDIPHYALKRLLNHRSDGDVTSGYICNDVERLRRPVERVPAWRQIWPPSKLSSLASYCDRDQALHKSLWLPLVVGIPRRSF